MMVKFIMILRSRRSLQLRTDLEGRQDLQMYEIKIEIEEEQVNRHPLLMCKN
jgi:hypothetical protein